MIVNWSSHQQYFGAQIITWDSAFAEREPDVGKTLSRHIFMAGRKRLTFEASEKDQYFVSKRDRIR